VVTKPIPEPWVQGIPDIDSIEDTDMSWYNTEILKYFDQKGIEFFEHLEIWYIKKYRELFLEKVGRKPKAKTYPPFIIFANKIKNRILKK
jgi:hypothetical protein